MVRTLCLKNNNIIQIVISSNSIGHSCKPVFQFVTCFFFFPEDVWFIPTGRCPAQLQDWFLYNHDHWQAVKLYSCLSTSAKTSNLSSPTCLPTFTCIEYFTTLPTGFYVSRLRPFISLPQSSSSLSSQAMTAFTDFFGSSWSFLTSCSLTGNWNTASCDTP